MNIVSEHEIKCGDCEKLLGRVLVSDKECEPQITRYRINSCPKCGGSSFWSKDIEGPTFFQSNLNVIPEKTDIIDGVIVNILKVIK